MSTAAMSREERIAEAERLARRAQAFYESASPEMRAVAFRLSALAGEVLAAVRADVPA